MLLSGRPRQLSQRPGRTSLIRSLPLKGERRLFASILLAAAVLGLAVVGATLSQPSGPALASHLQLPAVNPLADDLPQAQRRGGQEAERISVFEFVINSVIGRSLNVPGKD